MPPRVVVTGTDASGPLTLTGVQAGDLITVQIRERDGSAMTVSDSLNGSYTLAVSPTPTVARCAIYYFPNSAAGNPGVTVSGGTVRDFVICAWGSMSSGAVNATNSHSDAGVTNPTTGSVTPSGSALILAVNCSSGDHGDIATLFSGMTRLSADALAVGNRQLYAYKQAHTGAIDVQNVFNSSTSFDSAIAAFLETGGVVAIPCGAGYAVSYGRRR